jgi:hypothetical protein
MHPMAGSIAALAVASIYFVWKRYYLFQQHQQRTLRERVAYLLWVMAVQIE